MVQCTPVYCTLLSKYIYVYIHVWWHVKTTYSIGGWEGGRQLRENEPIKKLWLQKTKHNVVARKCSAAILTMHALQLSLCSSLDHRQSAAVTIGHWNADYLVHLLPLDDTHCTISQCILLYIYIFYIWV